MLSIYHADLYILKSVSKPTLISNRVLQKALASLPDWKCNAAGTKLTASFSHPDYVSGLVMIARIAVHAEICNHHPEIKYTYSKNVITLSTHECKGVSKKDIELATKISKLYISQK